MHCDWEPLAEGAQRCRLPFCDVTVGLVWGPAGVLLIDTGTTLAEAAAIDADVRRIAGRAVTHLVLTHAHFDHVLGSSMFAGADVHCAPGVLDQMAAPERLRADAIAHGADAAEVDRAVAALRPPRSSTHETVIDLGDRAVTVAHLGRGHTSSDLVVTVPGDRVVVFTGDLVEESADPAIDADSDVAAWPATLDRVLGAGGPDAAYVPGHGSVVDAAFVQRQRDWLRARPPLDSGPADSCGEGAEPHGHHRHRH